MKVRLDSARLLLHRAVVHAEKSPLGGWGFSPNSVAMRPPNMSEAIQIHGGYGSSSEFPLGYLYSRCRGWMIGGCTIEMMKNRIAERIFDRHFDQRPPRPPKV
jgi:hypothetical protein